MKLYRVTTTTELDVNVDWLLLDEEPEANDLVEFEYARVMETEDEPVTTINYEVVNTIGAYVC